MATVNISELYKKVFKVAPRYLVPFRGGLDMVPAPGYSGIEIWDEETSMEISPLGTPILEQITLQAGTYNTFEIIKGVPVKKTVEKQPYVFDLWPMIDMRQDKVIITTPINGRDGTVKEYIYTDDHQITIRGLLVGEGNSYPYDSRRELKNTFKKNSSYGVSSRVMNDDGVFALVIKSIEITDLEGYNNICPFVITAISDKDVLLEIKERN